MFGVGIISRGDFDDISGDEVNALQTTNDGSELTSGPATSLWSTRCWSDCCLSVLADGTGRPRLTSWIKSINVDGQIDWLLKTNTISDLLDDTIHADGINLSGLNNLKSTVSVVLIITGSAQGCANSRMDVCIVGKKSLLSSVIEVCTVVDTRDLAGRASKHLRLPCIQVGVEVDD